MLVGLYTVYVLLTTFPWCHNSSRCLTFASVNAPSAPVPGVTGLGYSGGSGDYSGGGANSNAPWDRGANLKDYYSKRDEQEAQAVGPINSLFLQGIISYPLAIFMLNYI